MLKQKMEKKKKMITTLSIMDKAFINNMKSSNNRKINKIIIVEVAKITRAASIVIKVQIIRKGY
jgi:hypothetical protein